MLDSKVIREVDRLSLKDRVALMEYTAQSVQRELQPKPRRKSKALPKPELPQEVGVSRGMLRRVGIPPLTDKEVEHVIADSLMELS